jgi:hypothetical protein
VCVWGGGECVKSKAIPVTDRGGPLRRIPHCLDNQIIDGGKVVSPTYRPHFTPPQTFFFLMFPVLIYVRG